MPIKREVERIVHPVKARERLKDVFREELWAHLDALYEEERAGGHDHVRALEIAVQRLGDAEALRAAFMESLSPLERWEGRVASVLRPKPGESALRHALKLASVTFAVPWSCLTAFLAATYPLPGMDAASYMVTAVTCALGLFVVAAFVGLRAFGGEHRDGLRRFATGILAISGATLMLWLGGRSMLAWALEMEGQRELLGAYGAFGTGFLARLCILLPVLLGITRRFARRRTLPDWPYAGPG